MENPAMLRLDKVMEYITFIGNYSVAIFVIIVCPFLGVATRRISVKYLKCVLRVLYAHDGELFHAMQVTDTVIGIICCLYA